MLIKNNELTDKAFKTFKEIYIAKSNYKFVFVNLLVATQFIYQVIVATITYAFSLKQYE